jgi:hypothetical protein
MQQVQPRNLGKERAYEWAFVIQITKTQKGEPKFRSFVVSLGNFTTGITQPNTLPVTLLPPLYLHMIGIGQASVLFSIHVAELIVCFR